MSFNISSVNDFRLKEEKIRSVFSSKYGGFCTYFEKNLELYLSCIRHFDKKEWISYRWEKRYGLILLVKLVSTFKSSYELIITGYYPESITLTRSIYEAFLMLLFIQKFPSRAEELAGTRFKIGNAEKELGIVNSSLYFIMSTFAHGSKADVLSDLVYTAKGTRTGISGGPQFPNHSDWFPIAMNSLMYYLWAILALLPKSQPEFKQNQILSKRYENLIRDFEHAYIRSYINKAGEPSRLAIKGVDEILKVINSLPFWIK